MSIDYKKKTGVAILREEWYALLTEGEKFPGVTELLLLERLVYRTYMKYGLTLLQEELDGTPLDKFHGWSTLDFQKLSEALVIKPKEITIRRAMDDLVEKGFMLVLKDESLWKKPNKYRPCLKAIKAGLDKLGYPLVIGKADVSEEDIEWGDDIAKEPPPVAPTGTPQPVTTQEQSWGAIPSANLTSSPEQKEAQKSSAEWAQKYRILANVDEHTRDISHKFCMMTGLDPSGTGNSWAEQINSLWSACEYNYEFFILVITKGEERRLENQDSTFAYTGPRSYIGMAKHLKSMKKSSVIAAKKQENLKAQMAAQSPQPSKSIPLAGNVSTEPRTRFILKPLST